MGMFDSIIVESSIEGIPADYKKYVSDIKEIIWQTKSFPDPGMMLYKIGSDGQLLVQKHTYEWVEGHEVPDGATFSEKLKALGHNRVIDSWWEKSPYTGDIEFYCSFKHPDLKDILDFENDQNYDIGWLEACATILHGGLVSPIKTIKVTYPYKLTEKEIEERQAAFKAAREDNAKRMKENRKKRPSAEQKLIDNIYNTLKGNVGTEEITEMIDKYREKHDIWYES